MNQYQWTFLDNKQQRHTLGIAHGPESGHMVVHCDHRVVLIEFEVLEPRTFSFFVEDELCKLSIEGNAEKGFEYDFHIDTEVDTEVNRTRNAIQVRTKRMSMLQAIGAIAFGLLFVGSIGYWGHTVTLDQLPDKLLGSGLRAQAKLVDGGDIEFIGGTSIIRGQPIGFDESRLTQLPLKQGDAVPVLFSEDEPSRFVIDWRSALRPLKHDTLRRGPIASAVLRTLAVELPSRAGKPACALRAADRIGGIHGQISFLDAYLAKEPEALAKWEARLGEPAYASRLRQVCTDETAL